MFAGKLAKTVSAETLADQAADAPAGTSTAPASGRPPVQMMLDKDKLNHLVALIKDKHEAPGYWPDMARFIFGVELDEEDIAYIAAGVQLSQPAPEPPVPAQTEASLPAAKMQDKASGRQETAAEAPTVERMMCDEGYHQLVSWLLENDIRALFFGDSHNVTDTMLPVEIVWLLAEKDMLHGVMMEFADNKDDHASENMLEDFVTKAGLREAATMQDVRMKQDPQHHSWHIMQIMYVLHKQGIPCHVFGSPNHKDTRETLKSRLGGVPPGKVMLAMIGANHLYPPDIGKGAGAGGEIPDSAFGLLSQQARREYGVNIAGFNGCWLSNIYKYGQDYMKDVIYVNQNRSREATRLDKNYEKVLFPNIRDMSDKGEPFENTRRFRERVYF